MQGSPSFYSTSRSVLYAPLMLCIDHYPHQSREVLTDGSKALPIMFRTRHKLFRLGTASTIQLFFKEGDRNTIFLREIITAVAQRN